MVKNYLITAVRNIVREKGSALLNIAGLTLGISCSLILFLMVRHILSFDDFHTKKDRIYRIVSQSEGNSGKRHSPGIPTVLPDAFRTEFPEAEEVVFTSYRSDAMVVVPQRSPEAPKKYFEESGIVFTEPGFFRIFDRPMLFGNSANSLDEPNEAIISKRWALKYFGKEDARNETLKFDTVEYRISGVMEDYQANTDFPFDLMLSYITIKNRNEKDGWHSIWSDEQCYFLLRNDAQLTSISSRLPAFVKKYLGDNVNRAEYLVQPLSEIHYDERFGTYTYSTISKGMLISFQTIAIVLLLTACINFINLATAEAIKRSKEVGIRKSLGSSRAQLIFQFLGDTTLITFAAVLSSVAVTQLALTFLNPFLELSLSMNFVSDVALWVYLIAITIAVAILAGLYPAFVVSGYSPVLALKNLVSNKTSSGYNLRRTLVISQFVISQLFIISTIVIIHQMDYFEKKDLGFNKDAMIVLPIPAPEGPANGNEQSKMRTLLHQLLTIPGVAGATLSSAPPSSGNVSNTIFTVEGNDQTYNAQIKHVDGNYIDLFDLKIIAGKKLDDFDTATGFVVNEKLVQTIGLQNNDEVLGKVLDLWGKKLPVIGVVKDFHTVSLHQPIEATVLMNRIRGYETLSLSVDMRRAQEIIASIKSIWETSYPEHIFDYDFLDQQIAEFYEFEKRMSVLLSIFSVIAIFIGCLGLYGLATFLVNQKTKEVGVRKVLGASVESILYLFSKEYVKLVFIGFLFSAPIAWFVIHKFLEKFTYKMQIGPAVFLFGFCASLTIAILTVAYKSIRSATANPVSSLRSE